MQDLIIVSSGPGTAHFCDLNSCKTAVLQHFHIFIKLLPGIIHQIILQADSPVQIGAAGIIDIPKGHHRFPLLHPGLFRLPDIRRDMDGPGSVADAGILLPRVHPS